MPNDEWGPRTPYVEIVNGDRKETVELLSMDHIDSIGNAYFRNDWQLIPYSQYIPATDARALVVELNAFCPFFRDALPDEFKNEWQELNRIVNECQLEEKIGVAISEGLWQCMRETIINIRAPDECFEANEPYINEYACKGCSKKSRYLYGFCDVCADCREKYYKRDVTAISA